MKLQSIIVRATWDEDAGVWVAHSSDVAGLATEAETLEDLKAKVLTMVPELIALNGLDTDLAEIPVHIMSEQMTKIPLPV